MTNRHRIIRRGRTYGPPLPEGVMEDDGQERGLVFVCFNASIWRQFETIQTLWIDDGDPFGLGPDKDFLIGEPDGDGKMTIPGHPPFFLKPHPRFVTHARRRVPLPAEHQRAALDGRAGRRGLVARAEPGGVTARSPSRASAGAPCNRTRRCPAP